MASDAAADADQVRRPRGGDQPVSFAELFFDLVYVVGVTQLAARLTGDLTWGGAFECLVLLLALWWAWVSTAWFTNAFDPDQRPVRAVLIAVMLASLVMTAAVPEAFGDRGTWFAGAYVAIQVGRTLYGVAALHRRHDPDDDTLRRDQERVLVWAVLAAVPWLVGGLVSGPARMALWLLALAIDYAAPAAGFRVPGLGRSATTDWEIEGQHLAERCQLFLIVAFGESILATGATFADEEPTAMTVASLAVAFGGNVALWWIYFDRAAEQAADTMARHHDPGRLGRAAYVYLHLPMVAGVLVTAVGDKLAVSNPTGTTAAATAATVLGGPALFVAGHALFKWVLFGLVSTPRLLGVAALAALVPAAAVLTPLTLSLLATLLLVGVAAWDVVCPPTLGQPPELATDGWPALTNRAGAPRGEGGRRLDAADVSVSLARA